MSHTSYIELSQKNLKHNIDYMKSQLNNGCRYSMVIKGNAYGHGIEDLIPLVENCHVDHFSVFSLEEAKRAFKVKSKNSDIMIMGFIDQKGIQWAIENRVSFYVFSKVRLENAIEMAKKINKKAKIHLELETGMNRTGFREEELDEILPSLIANKDFVEVEGICSHLAGAESISNYDRISNQIERFYELVSYLEKNQLKAQYLHLACSAGLLNFPETQLDLVRIGIANYGYWPSNELRMNRRLAKKEYDDPLKAVLSWKSAIMSLKFVPEGEYISYGSAYLTNRDMKIASIPVGYSYGFSRDLSNLGRVLIHKKRVPVVGVVNMNMMLVDVTDLPNVKEGDEVVLIGKQGELEISVSSFSDMSNSLNYELLASLPHFIPRLVVNE